MKKLVLEIIEKLVASRGRQVVKIVRLYPCQKHTIPAQAPSRRVPAAEDLGVIKRRIAELEAWYAQLNNAATI